MPDTDDLNIDEAHERAELVHDDRTLAPVSLTMAILAVAVAAISLLGHRAHTEELLSQTRANFQKAELVGAATQRHADEVLIGMLKVLTPANTAQAAALEEKVNREMQRYANELEQVATEERRLENESLRAKRNANRFDTGELFCEMALVLASITLLTRRRSFWYAGIVAGVVGFISAASAFLVA